MARRPASSSRNARPAGRALAPPPSQPPGNFVLLGEFGRPHGLRGEIRLKSYTADPLAIAGYAPLSTVDGRILTLADAKPAPGSAPDMLIVRVEGVGDRTGAEALTRTALYCPRDRLGEPDEEDAFFTADLVGLAAVDASGSVIGRIVDVPNYGGGDLLEIRPAAGGATALLPFTRAFVPVIDVAGGRVVLDPPEHLFALPGQRPEDDPG